MEENTQASQETKILIVEDDAFMGGLLERKFAQEETLGIFRATSVPEAREIIAKEDIKLVLLDIILPGVDGITFLQELKASETTKLIPVIIASNLGQPEEIEKGIREGAADYIVKAQATPAEIVAKVKTVLGIK